MEKKKKGISYYQGIFSATEKGFGFITPEFGEEDLFVPEDDTMNAMTGDIVCYRLSEDSRPEKKYHRPKKGEHLQAMIVKIIHHSMTQVVGTINLNPKKGYAFVIPDTKGVYQDIFVDKADLNGANDLDKVVVELTEYPKNPGRSPVGVVTEVLGNIEKPGVDILAIAKSQKLPIEFPEEVLLEAASIPQSIKSWDDDRLDYRDHLTVTIDSEDAKDLDDAISLEWSADENGQIIWHLGVHIADVSEYVTEGSFLDREALKRGTSVYFPDRVIPMLPKELSNGICSLNAHENRFALSCLMDLNSNGEIISHQIVPTVICVDYRMNYTDVNRILTEDPIPAELRETYAPVLDMLLRCGELSQCIRNLRGERGAIDFNTTESRILLDENGKVKDIVPHTANRATRLIEDFMLCANETVATDFFWQDSPFLYRIHEKPDDEKIREFSSFVRNMGFTLHVGNDNMHPKKFQKLLEEIEGTRYENLISTVLLRCMKKAEYSPINSGHFGLSSEYYTHFTSPIRRYPDLQIHRIMKESLKNGLSDNRRMHYFEILEQVAKQCSQTEIRATESERISEKMKKAQYMSEHIGEEFTGVISGITKYGFYVALDNTVEGLVRLADMRDDYYIADLAKYTVTGSRMNRTYSLGQTVRVLVTNADCYRYTVDFELA